MVQLRLRKSTSALTEKPVTVRRNSLDSSSASVTPVDTLLWPRLDRSHELAMFSTEAKLIIVKFNQETLLQLLTITLNKPAVKQSN